MVDRIATPEHVTGEAAEHFEELAEELKHRIRPHHSESLAAYCFAVEECRRLRREFRALPDDRIVVRGGNGQMKMNPLWPMLKDARKQVLMLGRELGLFPVSEAASKLPAAPPDYSDDPYAAHRTPGGL